MAFTREPHVEWRAVAPAFEPDGALRDIYVHHATLADWDAVLQLLRERYAPLEFTIDGEPAALPARVAEIFDVRGRAVTLLRFDAGGIGVACHFFTPDEIELDLRPEEVTGPERLAALMAFLRALAAAVGKPAVLTAENVSEAVILRAAPEPAD